MEKIITESTQKFIDDFNLEPEIFPFGEYDGILLENDEMRGYIKNTEDGTTLSLQNRRFQMDIRPEDGNLTGDIYFGNSRFIVYYYYDGERKIHNFISTQSDGLIITLDNPKTLQGYSVFMQYIEKQMKEYKLDKVRVKK